MGLSLADFDRLTPDEFDEVYRAWERAHLREGWEQARFLACSILQPWTKKALRATDVCRFAWDDEHLKALQAETAATASTRERFEELKQKFEQ